MFGTFIIFGRLPSSIEAHPGGGTVLLARCEL